MPDGNGRIDKLDYPTRTTNSSNPVNGGPSGSSLAGRFFEQVAESIQDQDRRLMKREVTRYVSFVWAILSR